MKLYFPRYYINYFGPDIALDYCFISIFIILVNKIYYLIFLQDNRDIVFINYE